MKTSGPPSGVNILMLAFLMVVLAHAGEDGGVGRERGEGVLHKDRRGGLTR